MNKRFESFLEVEALNAEDLENESIRQQAIACAEHCLENAQKLFQSACRAPKGSILNVRGKQSAEEQIERIANWLSVNTKQA